MSQSFQIEVLYFKGCPNHEPTIERVRQAMTAEAVDRQIEQIEVTDGAMAQKVRFLGSPSVRVNGVDVEETARDAETFGLGCRTYFEQNRRSGLPSIDSIRRALMDGLPASTREGSK